MEEVKIYIAGFDIFRPDALDFCRWQKAVAKQNGFMPLHPIDNDVGDLSRTRASAKKIYWADIKQLQKAQVVVANCNYFRGGDLDSGTAYEIGYAHGQCKIVYGYIDSLVPGFVQLLARGLYVKKENYFVDPSGYLIDDFDTAINLMLHEGLEECGGCLIAGDFEEAVRTLRADIDSGRLKIP